MTSASVLSPAPPQPCAAVIWFYAVLFLSMGITMTWFFLAEPLLAGASLQPVAVAMLIFTTALLAWVFARTVLLGRVRLTEDGVWPNRRGHPEFVAWKGATIRAKGYYLYVENGLDVAEINMVSFCRQRPLLEFLQRKFPSARNSGHGA